MRKYGVDARGVAIHYTAAPLTLAQLEAVGAITCAGPLKALVGSLEPACGAGSCTWLLCTEQAGRLLAAGGGQDRWAAGWTPFGPACDQWREELARRGSSLVGRVSGNQ